jgi:hypothetical protein
MKPAKEAHHAIILRAARGKYQPNENKRTWPQNARMGKPSRQRGWQRGRQ